MTQLQSDEYVYTVCEVYEPQSVVSPYSSDK